MLIPRGRGPILWRQKAWGVTRTQAMSAIACSRLPPAEGRLGDTMRAWGCGTAPRGGPAAHNPARGSALPTEGGMAAYCLSSGCQRTTASADAGGRARALHWDGHRAAPGRPASVMALTGGPSPDAAGAPLARCDCSAGIHARTCFVQDRVAGAGELAHGARPRASLSLPPAAAAAAEAAAAAAAALRSQDRVVVLSTVAQGGHALQFASAELRGDVDVVMAAVAQSGRALEHAAAKLRGDRRVVLTAVLQSGRALQHASEALRGDKEVVLAAVAQDGSALQFASRGLRTDGDTVRAALAQHGNARWYAAHAEELNSGHVVRWGHSGVRAQRKTATFGDETRPSLPARAAPRCAAAHGIAAAHMPVSTPLPRPELVRASAEGECGLSEQDIRGVARAAGAGRRSRTRRAQYARPPYPQP